MLERETFLGRIAELLRNLQTKASGPDPERAQRGTRHGEKLVAQEEQSAKEFTEKALSEKREEKLEAQKRAQRGRYLAGDRDAARQELTDAQTAIGAVPAWLQVNPGTVQSAEVATFYRVLTEVPELQDNPYVLYREAARLYWSTNWTSASAEVVRQTREVIAQTLQQVQMLSAQSGEHHIILEAQESGLWRGFNNRLDLYRTERLPDLDPATSTPEQQHQHERLDARLKQAQTEIDARSRDPRDEERMLKRMADDLAKEKASNVPIRDRRGRVVGHERKFNEQEVQRYIDQVDGRLSELHGEIQSARTGRRGEQKGGFDVKDYLEEQPKLFAELVGLRDRVQSPQLRAKIDYYLEKRGKLGWRALQSLYDEVAQFEIDGVAWDETRGILTAEKLAQARLTNLHARVDDITVTNRELEGRVSSDVQALRKLRELISVEASLSKDYRPQHSWWYTPEGQAAWEKMKTLEPDEIIAYLQSNNARHLEGIDEIIFEIMSVADDRPRNPFNDAVDLYVNADINTFFGILKKSLRELSASGSAISDKDIRRILERYTALRNAKELAHNLGYISSVGDLELLGKFAGQLLSGDIDFMYHNIPGIELAQHARESTLVRLEADYGYLPSDALSGDETAASLWEDMAFEEFKLMLESDLLGDQGREMLAKYWKMKNALEFGFAVDIVDLRFSDMLTRSKDAADYASKPKEKLGLDPIHGIFLKYQTNKPALTMLYFVITGDQHRAIEFWRDPNWSIDKMLNMYFQAQADPRFQARIADIKNIADISGRFGMRSMWGVRRGGEMMPKEEYEQRGIGLKIADAGGRITEEFRQDKKTQLEGFYGKDHPRVGRELEKYMTDPKIKEQIGARKRQEIRIALEEGLAKLPLVFARRMRAIKGPWEDTRFMLLQQSIIEAGGGQGEVNRILGGGGFDVHYGTEARQVASFADLAREYPANKGGSMARPERHLREGELTRVRESWERMRMKIDEIEHNLAVVQQHAIANNHSTLDADFAIIRDDHLRLVVKKYADLIKREATAVKPFSGFGLNGKTTTLQKSYIDELTDRYVEGRENFLFTTEDTPYASFDWHRMGDRGVLRGILDAQAAIKGVTGLSTYMEVMTAEPKIEELVDVMRKEIFNNLAMYDDTAAQQFCYLIAKQTLRYYAEKGWASYSGPVGDLMGAKFVADALHKRGWYSLMTSINKVMGDPTGESWGPNERFKFIHVLNGRHVLAKDNPFGWGMGRGFTMHDLEHETASGPLNAIYEYASYVPFIGPVIMVWQATKKEQEESERR